MKITKLALYDFLPFVSYTENHKKPWYYDKEPYKRCNEVERYFLILKCLRKVFNRYDKLDITFVIVVMLAIIFASIFM